MRCERRPARFPIGRTASIDRKSTRLNSSHQIISYAVFCFKKKIKGLLKPGLYRFIIATIAFFYRMNVRGGTQGVRRATTHAHVPATVLLLYMDVIFPRLLI